MSNFLERFTLIQKLLLLLVTFTLCVVAIVLSASATISLVRIGGDLQTAITKDADLLGDLVPPALGLEEAHDAVLSLRISTEATAQQRGFAQLQHAQERFQQAIAMWEKDPHEDDEQQQIMGPIRKTAEEFYALALGDYSRAVQNFDTDRIAQLGVTLDTIHQRQDVALEKLADEVLRNSRAYRHEAATQTSASISRTYWIAGGGLLLAGGIFVLVLTSIRRQIGGDPAYARDIMRRVLEGETELQLQLAEGDRDSLMASISRLMQSSVENWRLRSALNNVTANVMVADNAFNIVYCNPAVMDMFQSAEADIRTELPQFRASEILGGSIDRFHKNPAHQRGMLERLSSTYSAQIQLGGRTLTVVANPVLGQKGQRLGAVVEWQDITEQLAIEQKAAALAAENSRVRSALDNVTANVMIADRDFNIVYCNEAVMDMFRTAEADIRTELPQFRTSEILGGSIDRFHKNPAHQRGMLEKLSSTYRAQINLGGRTLTVVANPVMGVDGQRLGAVVEWQDITVQLAAEQKAASLAAENARVRSALDNVTTNVMIADNDRNIIYMNKTVTAMLQNAEADLRKALPNFDVNKLLGGTMDQFHRNPEHQKQLLAKLTNTYRAQIEVSGRTFALIANPVMSSSGERIGSVVEWNDRTLEVAVEREVAELVNAAGSGNFTLRIEEAGKSGFFLNLATGLNQLMATADKGLNDVARVLGAIAQGDLTQRIEDEYRGTFGQLKDFSNETSGSLSRMLGQIREAADTIYTASNEISVGNNDLSSRTEEQASSLEETASSMEELTSTVKLNADNARQANSLAVNASEVAVAGGNVVEQVVQTMASINDSARKIADIIGVIDGIAFQTNILALNAAVEAARAGEQGRGFAVVAGEVRTLAQRSAAAAKEIKSLISDSVDKVDNGNHLVAQAGKTMSEIVVAIKRVTDIMAEIAAASAEQSNGIEEINGAVNQMDEMTQQNAALVEQAAASAESLLEQASSLSQAVAVFKFEHAVGSGLPAPHAAKPPLRAVASSPRPAPKPSRFNATPSKAKDEGWEEF